MVGIYETYKDKYIELKGIDILDEYIEQRIHAY